MKGSVIQCVREAVKRPGPASPATSLSPPSYPYPSHPPPTVTQASGGICSSLAWDISYHCLFQENQLRNDKLLSTRKVTAQAINKAFLKHEWEKSVARSLLHTHILQLRFSFGKMREHPTGGQKGSLCSAVWVHLGMPSLWWDSVPQAPGQAPGLVLVFFIAVISSQYIKGI